MKLSDKAKQYAKGIIAVIAALAVPAQAAIDDGQITADEVVAIVIVGLGAAGVIAVPNAPTDRQRNQVVADLKRNAVYVPEEW